MNTIKNRIKNYIANNVREEIRIDNPAYRINYDERHYLAITLDQLSNTNMWWVDAVKYTEDCIEINGWAIVPHSMQNQITFTVNHVVFDEVTYPLCNPSAANKYYFKPNVAMCGFNCKKLLQKGSFTLTDDFLIFNVVDKATLNPLDGYYNFHSQTNKSDGLPDPDDSNLARIGATGLEHSKAVAFSKFMRLQEASIKYVNRSFGELQKVLDWGCGCGLVLRYFYPYKNVEVHGADVDSINIQWCENNLGFAKFHHVPLLPPTQFESEYFDLIFGISVVTHLRENDQSAWLAELSRITRKGGIVLLSVHGDGGVAFRNELFDFNKLLAWQQKGFIAIGVDGSINDTISDKEYYTTSFQTERYINKEWGKYFQVLDVIPSYIGHFQDLVVLQKT